MMPKPEIKERSPLEQMAAKPGPGARRSRYLSRYVTWAIYAAVILAICALALMALLNVSHESVPALLERARSAARIGTTIQAGLALWVLLRWHRLIAWCRLKRIVHKGEHRRLLALRTKAAAAMALYLLLVPIGPATLVQLAQSISR